MRDIDNQHIFLVFDRQSKDCYTDTTLVNLFKGAGIESYHLGNNFNFNYTKKVICFC